MSNFIDDLDRFILAGVQEVKQAEERGATSHPSEKAEDGNQAASTGARASEHEKDVKAQVPGQTVNEAKGSEAEGAGRGENSPVLNTVVKSKATGEDAAVETASAKAKPEDPGTSHPAKADMGEKFSAAQLKGIGDEILADIAVATVVKQAAPVEKKAEEKVETPVVEKIEKAVEAASGETGSSGETSGETGSSGETSGETSGESYEKDEKKAEQAGKEAAAAVIEKMAQPVVSKEQIVDSIVKQASQDAENVADYLAGFYSKQAMDAGDTGNTVMDETSAGPAGAGAEGGAGAGDAEIEQIVQALLQAGVSPEELLALVEGGGAQGGAPAAGPEGAGAAAMPAAMPAEAPKMASAEKSAAMKSALLKVIAQSKGA